MTETVPPAVPPGTPPPVRQTASEAPRPGSRLPEIPGPLETAFLLWRWLRKMSTALLLLFALALASVLATFVPQRPNVPSTVTQWREGLAGPGEQISAVFDWLGLFDVFGSWWFTLLVTLLFVSLTGCLLPRWRAFLRVVRRPPATGRNLDRLGNNVVLATSLPTEEALAVAQRTLRRARFRSRRLAGAMTANGLPQVAAERGHAREGGSLVFHSAFYILLAGVVIGQAFGFTGHINLPEGAQFADTRLAYDASKPGRLFGLEDHRGFVVSLDDFDVSYFPNFVPKDFTSTVTIIEGGVPVRTEQVRVNHPLVHRGVKLYQARFGLAPRVVVRANDRVVFDDRVLLQPVQGQNLWAGTAKVFATERDKQLALDLVLAPDAQLGPDGEPRIGPSPEARNPVLLASVYFGALGLERPVPAEQFDRGAGPVGEPQMLRPGKAAAFAAGNLDVEFADLGHWSGFQVTRAPGRSLLLLAAGLVLAGLLPSLYSYRRRVWVEAEPDGAATRLRVAGVALQRKPTFAEEFERLTGALRAALPPGEAGDEESQ